MSSQSWTYRSEPNHTKRCQLGQSLARLIAHIELRHHFVKALRYGTHDLHARRPFGKTS